MLGFRVLSYSRLQGFIGAATGAELCVLLASGERPAVWGMCAAAAHPVLSALSGRCVALIPSGERPAVWGMRAAAAPLTFSASHLPYGHLSCPLFALGRKHSSLICLAAQSQGCLGQIGRHVCLSPAGPASPQTPHR